MDFINNNRKKIRTVLLVILTISIFSLSYYLCINKLKSTNLKEDKYKVQNESKDIDKTMTVDSNMNTSLSPNAKVIFEKKYIKSGEVITEKEESAGNLAGKKKSELNQVYKGQGYSLESMKSSEVVFVKEFDRYAPNKYVVGIKDGFIAIYKTDKDGNMFIEDEKRDVTDIKTDRLKKADIELLTKGDKYFQCNTREDAEARLEDYE
ncbi:hypothetical protein Ccar_17120 [Clostridium carboxidivorans P7]|uniref:hypothetical protein n=1 Tax=Clostridium carboxidivorans TaxID=217159 RepID=UPI0001D393A8|nr:hypothetical protein [Clostridium carboxidivorans]AKN32485.1 hypothetical protein Ccar_17120 [Clostridium carboxidivorans P7]EFG87635.1 hypothetical protein CLCAR_2645 [Clostridium carboxidivorans P7]